MKKFARTILKTPNVHHSALMVLSPRCGAFRKSGKERPFEKVNCYNRRYFILIIVHPRFIIFGM